MFEVMPAVMFEIKRFELKSSGLCHHRCKSFSLGKFLGLLSDSREWRTEIREHKPE